MGTDSIARNTDSRKSDKPFYHVDPEGYGVTEEIESRIRRQAWKIGSEHGNYGEIDDRRLARDLAARTASGLLPPSQQASHGTICTFRLVRRWKVVAEPSAEEGIPH